MEGPQDKGRRDFGAQQERVAADYLGAHGLTLVTHNYQCRAGEIDLIMRDGDTLIFVEVRYRRNNHYGGPLESVTAAKQRKLLRCARHYLLRYGLTDAVPCRFDVLGISPGAPSRSQTFQWIRNAFGVNPV